MNVINLGYCHTSHLCPRTTVRMECPDAVLVLLCQVAANLDGNRRIDHADQRGRESDVPQDRLSLSHNETMQKHNSVLRTHTVEMQELLASITMCFRTAQLKLKTSEHIYKSK